MKRWLTNGMIAGYLGAVVIGVAAHAVQFHSNSHPLNYFFVWDMFCGWSAWEQRLHVVGEGDSGTLYELAPGPWANFKPYGDISRHHYDSLANHAGAIAANTLRQTEHEPIRRVFLYEEVWAKKYNLPDSLKQKLTPVPGERRSYFHLRHIYAGDGTPIQKGPSWYEMESKNSLMNNPRLRRDTGLGRPAYVIDRHLARSGTALRNFSH